MTQTDTKTKVVAIIAEQLKVKDDLIKPATLIEDLGADEFDMMEIVMKLEDQFGLVIEDEDAAQMGTVEEVTEYISERKK